MPRRPPSRFVRSFAKWACTVAAVAALALWGFSFWYDVVWRKVKGVQVSFTIERGRGAFVIGDRFLPYPNGYFRISVAPERDSAKVHPPLLDTRLYVQWRLVRIGGPLWLPALAFALPAAFFWWRDSPAFRRRRAMRRNECPACGYSLAGLATGGECPECGAKAAAQ